MATGEQTRFVYDGWQVIEERNGSGEVTAAYVYGNSPSSGRGGGGSYDSKASDFAPPLLMLRDGKTYFYHYNHLGSIEALTDQSGAVVERYTYAPFGQVTITDAAGNVLAESAIGNPYFFTGQRWDAATGLYDYRHREYSPTLGQLARKQPASCGYYMCEKFPWLHWSQFAFSHSNAIPSATPTASTRMRMR